MFSGGSKGETSCILDISSGSKLESISYDFKEEMDMPGVVKKPHDIEWTAEKIQTVWDFYSTSAAHKSLYFGETAGGHFVRVLRRKGLLKNKRSIIDISCGTGAIIENILNQGVGEAKVLGFDPSSLSVEKTNQRNRGANGYSGAYKINSYPIAEIETDSIDLVIMTEVIEHLDDLSLNQVMTECFRILSRNGHLVITTPNNEDLARSTVICPECACVFHRWQHQRSWSESNVKKAMDAYGFESSIFKISWGNEWIDFVFSAIGRKKTGLLVVCSKPLDKEG